MTLPPWLIARNYANSENLLARIRNLRKRWCLTVFVYASVLVFLSESCVKPTGLCSVLSRIVAQYTRVRKFHQIPYRSHILHRLRQRRILRRKFEAGTDPTTEGDIVFWHRKSFVPGEKKCHNSFLKIFRMPKFTLFWAFLLQTLKHEWLGALPQPLSAEVISTNARIQRGCVPEVVSDGSITTKRKEQITNALPHIEPKRSVTWQHV